MQLRCMNTQNFVDYEYQVMSESSGTDKGRFPTAYCPGYPL